MTDDTLFHAVELTAALDKAIREEPDSPLAYTAILLAYRNEHVIRESGLVIHIWDRQLLSYSIDDESHGEHLCTVEYHGLTKDGRMKFRMFHELYKWRKWHTVYLPPMVIYPETIH